MRYDLYNFNENSIHFAYRRKSENKEHIETFHSHLGIEFLLIHQGSGTMIVNNRSYEIKPGMLCIFQPYQLHHLKLDYSNNPCFERSLAIFEPSMFEAYFEKWPILHTYFRHIYLGNLSSPCLYGLNDQHILVHLFKTFVERIPYLNETNRAEEVSLFLINVFHTLKPLWDELEGQLTVSTVGRKSHQVERILEWIEKNYHVPYRLDDLAQSLHLSSYHLSHLFKEATGVSISQYIAARRIHQSVRLITTTNKPISFIAEEVGLTNVSYFCKLFKEQMDVTPHQYRKRWINHSFRLE
ncbi:AraC family transcriptional regulator [Paenibacillus crassostreae]|uniref:AraC family transcriptional regulator n=1 Tax=Paenibacillus crassostreae TaxID=1763538 RepID=A0A167F8L2_9BACL|nr:AraC family transcriptional regulator [Paenibacillus crassostreae]OAB76306.1 AraC family transcriptional regulator [Paenibacillus crassostreae]